MSNKEEKTTPEVEEVVESEEVEATTEPTAEEKIAELEAKLAEQNDKYTRLYAEYDNFRKRSQREKDARYSDAIADAASAILPIGDNLERALAVEVESEEAKTFKAGVEMVMKQFEEVLTKLEIEPIKALGEQFDPNLHNAVMHIEDETTDDNTIVEEFMKGYIYKGEKVVRYSMVKVAN